MSIVRSSPRAATRRLSMVAALIMLVASPLLSGCLERSTTVGDRYSGTVIVATSPDNPRGAPKLDLPESMASRVSLTDYRETPQPAGASTPPSGASTTTTAPRSTPGLPSEEDRATRVGTRATFSGLTAGQFGQLGNIVAEGVGDTAVTMDLDAKRSGEVVRFRGTTDLSDLNAQRDFVQLTVTFAGPITATNGEQTGESSVTWTPEPGKPSDFSADATYPDPATAAVSSWSWFIAIVCVIVVIVIIVIAYQSRDRSPRPGRPKKTGGSPKSTTGTASSSATSAKAGSSAKTGSTTAGNTTAGNTTRADQS